MAKYIRLTDPLPKVIRDTSATQPLIDPAAFAAAMGAELTDVKMPTGASPVSRFALRMELFRRLHSGGPRSTATNTQGRADIPLADAEWAGLERLAKLVTGPGYAPSAVQVAHTLIRMSLQKLLAEIDGTPDPAASPLVRDLAAHS